MFFIKRLTLVSAFLILFSGCKRTSYTYNSFNSFFKETVVDSVSNYSVEKDVRIDVANLNGSITIKGHPHNNVTLTVTKHGNKDEFSKVRPIISAAQKAITIETESEPHYKNVSIDYELLVPETAHLELIKNVNGSIDIQKVTGPITAKTVNGDILINSIANSATITSINGSIECFLTETIDAALKAKANLGKIETNFDIPKTTTGTGQSIQGIIGTSEKIVVKLKTTNGDIRIKKN